MDWATLTRAFSPLAFVAAVLWGAANLFAQVNDLERRMVRLEARFDELHKAELLLERRMMRVEAEHRDSEEAGR